ncbi:DUF4231 domain-containing protein [Amycolatopsis sp. NPDC005003]
MSDVTHSHPEVAELDEHLRTLDEERTELRIRWRWAIAGCAAAPLAAAAVVTILIYIGDASLTIIGIFAVIGAAAGATACGDQALKIRASRLEVDRKEKRIKFRRSETLANRAKRSAAPYARYKEHLPHLADNYKVRAKRYRRVYVILQLTIIVGSLSTSAVTAMADTVNAKAVAVAISLTVGIAASCTLTFRLRERGETLQKTATEIEREYRAAELEIADYADTPDEKARYRKLVERVEMLRADQLRKERALDQPPDLNQSTDAGIGIG